MKSQVFTANRLHDGIVVYMTEDGHWSESVFGATVVTNDEGLAAMTTLAEAGETNSIIVAPYPIDVELEDGQVRPVSYRERLRAFGPSIHPEFAKLPTETAA